MRTRLPAPSGTSGGHADRYEAVETTGPVLWRSLRRRWYLLLLAGLLGASVGYGVSQTRPPVYEATATLLLSDRAFADGGATLRPDSVASLVELHTERVATPDTLRLAAAELAVDELALAEVVTTRPDVPALAVTVVARVQDSDQAAAIADAVALAYESTANGRGRSARESALEKLQGRIDVLGERIDEATAALETRPTDPVAMSRLDGLVTQQLELQLRMDELPDVRTEEIVSTVLPAAVPTAPSSPLPVRDAVLVGLAAALAAAAAIWLGRTHASEARSSLGEVVDAPLLAELPRSSRITGLNRRVDTAGVADAIHLISGAVGRFKGDHGAVVLFAGVAGEHDRRQLAEQTAAATGWSTDVTVLRYRDRRENGRWPIPPTNRVGSWLVARRPPDGQITTTMESVKELTHARAMGSLVIVAGPDAGSPEVTNLALASDSVILVVSSKDSVSDLRRLRRLLDVIAVPVMGYVYSERPG